MTEEQPWWHSTPQEPPVDSVLEEGMKLFAVLKDWAVESGAMAAVSDLAVTAAASASSYLEHAAEPQVTEESVATVRCTDCPVCRGLDALDAANPQVAETARAALRQVNGLLGGLLRG